MTVQSPIWHPLTQMKRTPALPKVTSAKGAKLFLEDGREIIDLISSWWTNIHGHANEKIAEAIYRQASTLEHVIFANFTHEPAQELSERLLAHLPDNLRKVFFSDNGSTAVEVALKMAFQYWLQTGNPQKQRFIGFEGGYHGDTVGAMSISGSSTFSGPFAPLLFPIDCVPYPATFDDDDFAHENENQALGQLSRLLTERGGEYAGIVIEPLIQGAGGMRICRPSFLASVQALAREHNVLLIYDEVMTGFGRTGDWFACTRTDTAPDIICLSKGITGGFLPLAVTVSTDEIFDAFLSDSMDRMFCHSHSYTGNPIACAAGVASLDLMEENEHLFREMESTHRVLFDQIAAGTGLFDKFRTCGTIAAFNVVTGCDTGYFGNIGPHLREKFIERNLLLRPLGNTVYLMPPYCIDEELLSCSYKTIVEVVEAEKKSGVFDK